MADKREKRKKKKAHSCYSIRFPRKYTFIHSFVRSFASLPQFRNFACCFFSRSSFKCSPQSPSPSLSPSYTHSDFASEHIFCCCCCCCSFFFFDFIFNEADVSWSFKLGMSEEIINLKVLVLIHIIGFCECVCVCECVQLRESILYRNLCFVYVCV